MSEKSPTNPGWKADDTATAHYFQSLIQQHGVNPRAVDWGSKASQEKRFEILAGVGPLAGCSVLDVGCGLGDFLGWLQSQSVQVNYTGIDVTPAMIEKACERFVGVDFQVSGVLDAALAGSYDYVFASGIFYRRQVEPWEFLQQAVTQMFACCRKGLAFNSLSTWFPEPEAGEFYADPVKTLEWCRSLTPRVALRHDYHPRDFTIYLSKVEA